MNKRERLREILARNRTLWVPGAYDALSAKLAEAAGFEAVFSTGYGVAASYLGMPDAGLYTATEILAVTRNMVAATSVPLIADCDTGYGNPINVMRTVREFEAAGVAGLLLEDQAEPKKCPAMTSDVELVSIEEGAAKIRAAVAARLDPNLVIVARTDARDEREAIRRLNAYASAGADLVHVISSCCQDIEGLARVKAATGKKLSVPVLGWLETQPPASVETVADIAYLPFAPLFSAVHALKDNLAAMARSRSVIGLPSPTIAQSRFKELIGFAEMERLHDDLMRGDARA